MQALTLMEPRRRKPKDKKPTISVTYRLSKEAKFAIEEMAEQVIRSENLQVEYSIKVAYLHYRGINIYGMSDLQITNKFDETLNYSDTEN